MNYQGQMSPNFVYPQGAPNFYNGYTPAIMYVRNVGPNSGNVPSGNASNVISQGVAAPLANYNTVANQAWYIDFSVTNHVTKSTGTFWSYSNYTTVGEVAHRKGPRLIHSTC